jgi:ankyrin repeat protein
MTGLVRTLTAAVALILAAAACLPLPDFSRKDPTTDYRYKGIIAAAAEGDLARVRAFLARNPALVKDVTPRRGLTPLHVAAMSCYPSHLRVARLLIGHGAPLNARCDDGATPLHYAARYCCLGMVALLVTSGAATTLTNHDLRTPGQEAAYQLAAQNRLTSRRTELKLRCRAVIEFLRDNPVTGKTN